MWCTQDSDVACPHRTGAAFTLAILGSVMPLLPEAGLAWCCCRVLDSVSDGTSGSSREGPHVQWVGTEV